MTQKHFLDLDKFDAATLRSILDQGKAFKAGTGPEKPLAGKTLAMIFEKPSTRTRVSFEVGMRQLGGDVVVLTHGETQLGRGETIADTARVLSRYVDAIMIRTDDPAKLYELAEHATVPVINGLTDATHPCQIMADVMTVEEHLGPIKGKIATWTGDGNNVAASWIHASAQFDFEMRVACPSDLEPDELVVDWARDNGATVSVGQDVQKLVEGADVVVTDTWISMGEEGSDKHAMLQPYQVNGALMAKANPKAIFMHCLPAHREEEATAEVLDGPQSVIFDEAENRLHAQKGILHYCLSED